MLILTRLLRMDFPAVFVRSIWSDFEFYLHFSMKSLLAKRIFSDRTLHFAVSNVGLYRLPLSHKKDNI